MPMTTKFHHSMWPERRRQRLQESPRDWASPFVNKPSPLLRPPLPLLQVLTFLPCPLGLNPRHYRWQPRCRKRRASLKKKEERGEARPADERPRSIPLWSADVMRCTGTSLLIPHEIIASLLWPPSLSVSLGRHALFSAAARRGWPA